MRTFVGKQGEAKYIKPNNCLSSNFTLEMWEDQFKFVSMIIPRNFTSVVLAILMLLICSCFVKSSLFCQFLITIICQHACTAKMLHVLGFALNGINNVNIPMYERRFGLTSTETGLEASFYDVIAGCCVSILSSISPSFSTGVSNIFGPFTNPLRVLIANDAPHCNVEFNQRSLWFNLINYLIN